MLTVHEVEKLTGVSVRTLHHYDSIGLLKPSRVTDAGYRLYDENAVEKLRSILIFKELRFSLGEIKNIMCSPAFDTEKAIDGQIELLEQERLRLDELISYAREIKKGKKKMSFEVFDTEKYKKEAKEKWGGTEAWAEYEKKAEGRDERSAADGMWEIFRGFGAIKHLSPASDEAKEKVGELKAFITKNYYTCTDVILASLGEMYVGDERFRENIDAVGGDGTAEFVHLAIKEYVK